MIVSVTRRPCHGLIVFVFLQYARGGHIYSLFFWIFNPPALATGYVPDAVAGEFVHQQLKRADKSSSGWDTPAHYARLVITTA